MEELKWNGSKLFGWGNSTFGELNPASNLSEKEKINQVGNRDKRLSFSCNGSKLSVQGLKFKNSIIDLAAGPNFVLALTSSGLEGWGCSKDYQLGRGNGEEYQVQTEPKKVDGIKAYHSVHSISCGEYHAAAATNEGLFVWGTNNFGQLGIYLPEEEDQHDPIFYTKRKDWSLPVLVPLFKEKSIHISFVACGDGFTLALTDSGELYAWGINSWGQLGTGDRGNKKYPFKIDTNGVTFKHLSAGPNHSVGIDSNGSVYSWGLATYGQLGLEPSETSKGLLSDEENLPYVLKPTKISSLNKFNIVQTACGSDFTLFRDSNGRVFACGYSTLGQCGQGNRRDQKIPVPVNFGTDVLVSWIAAGSSHSVAVSNTGQVWTWGSGTSGQLGHSSAKDEIRPKLVQSLSNEKVDMVVCGSTFTLALVGRSFRNIESETLAFDEKFSDIRFNFGGTEAVLGHKVVLWSKNPSFFEVVTEGNERVESVEVSCISKDLFQVILDFIYYNRIPKTVEDNLLQELKKLLKEKPQLNLDSLLCRMEERPDTNSTAELHFSPAYLNPKFSDVELIVEERRFPCHKSILSSRSFFFRAMFGGVMREAEQKEVVLPEIRAKVFELMLEYIYKGDVKDLTPTLEEDGENVTDAQDAIDLLQLASEYNMNQLVGLCEVALQPLIQSENVIQLFAFSTFISAPSLRETCIQFILDHLEELEEELKGEEMWQTQEMKDRVYTHIQFGKSTQIQRDKNQKIYDETREDSHGEGVALLARVCRPEQLENKGGD